MSNVSSTHAISEFNSGVSQPLDGQVLIVSRGNAKSKTVSVCASLPKVTEEEIRENLTSLIPHVVNMIDSTRAKLVRLAHAAGESEIRTECVNVKAVVQWLNEQEAESGRLSKESIIGFLESPTVKDTLYAAFAVTLKYDGETLTGEQLEKLSKMHKGFIDVISELSGSRTMWEEKKQNTARKYLETLEDSPMRERLLGKLEDMAKRAKQNENVLDALGF